MLYGIISSIKGCRFAHIITLTEVKVPKKMGIVGKVEKRFDGEIQLNYSYENAVNNRLEKQGYDRTFESEKLTWGQWEIFNKIISHNGTRYLRYYTFKGSVKPKVEYFVDGRAATADEINIIKAVEIAKNKGSRKQASEGLTENQVKPKVVKFENILSLKVDGMVYIKPISSTLPMVG